MDFNYRFTTARSRADPNGAIPADMIKRKYINALPPKIVKQTQIMKPANLIAAMNEATNIELAEKPTSRGISSHMIEEVEHLKEEIQVLKSELTRTPTVPK